MASKLSNLSLRGELSKRLMNGVLITVPPTCLHNVTNCYGGWKLRHSATSNQFEVAFHLPLTSAFLKGIPSLLYMFHTVNFVCILSGYLSIRPIVTCRTKRKGDMKAEHLIKYFYRIANSRKSVKLRN